MNYRVSSRMWPWRFSLCLVAGFAIHATLFHLDLKRLLPGSDPTGIEKVLVGGAVVFVPTVIGLFLASRVVLELTDDGLTRRWLFRRASARWDEIVRVRLGWVRCLLGLGAVLELNRPKRKLWLSWRTRPATLGLEPAHADGGRLLREVLARAPHAEVGKRVRDYLAAPTRPPWAYRLPVLLVLALQAGLCIVGLVRAVVSADVGMDLGGVVGILAVVPPTSGGSSSERAGGRPCPSTWGPGSEPW